jgi:hypothetical protein
MALLALAAGAAQAGQISGTITDPAGKGLAQVNVVALVKPPDKSGPQNFQVKTAADGTFTIPNTPAGNYRICVPAHPGYLDPCKWSGTQPSGAIAAVASNVKAGTIALEAGTPIQVQVVDDNGSLKQNQNKTPGASLLIGVWTPAGLFVPMDVASTDVNGTTTQQVYVPYSKNIHVSVTSSAFNVTDSKSKPVAADGNLADVQVAPGAKANVIVIHVKGLAQGKGK